MLPKLSVPVLAEELLESRAALHGTVKDFALVSALLDPP